MFITEDFFAQVVQVTDGDTIRVTAGQHLVTIRIAFVDAPETGQEYALQSQRFLSRLLYGQTLRVIPIKGDRYGRLIARLELKDGKDVSKEILQKGWAWYYDPKHWDESYTQYELEAQKEARGIWISTRNIAPWIWRKQRHAQ